MFGFTTCSETDGYFFVSKEDDFFSAVADFMNEYNFNKNKDFVLMFNENKYYRIMVPVHFYGNTGKLSSCHVNYEIYDLRKE